MAVGAWRWRPGRAYLGTTKFTFQLFAEGIGGPGLATFLTPLTLDLRSVEEAREVVGEIGEQRRIPAHSVMLTSEDGSVSERWFQLDGKWRRKGV